MHTMTRAGWQARVAAKQDRFGGDFWNTDRVWQAVFADGAVTAATLEPLTTGLWADVVCTLADGRRVTRRFFA